MKHNFSEIQRRMPFPPYMNRISHKITALKIIVNETFSNTHAHFSAYPSWQNNKPSVKFQADGDARFQQKLL